ncbi:MAG: aromatic-ring-hydroxylating dioxygenase subunit beta [Alphaproteobacteria bacterium]|nr:aromatic-ring-hydroxylating dioxygenase subunit beta [Alphaproteobacteria bacterium]
MIAAELRFAIDDLFADYGACLDNDRLEDWLELFSEDCVYKIVPRENAELGLPVTLMLCENKNMLRDRIVSLRQANEYSVHTDKHLITNVRVKDTTDDGGYSVEANYTMYQADNEGSGSLYSFGTYIDEVVHDGDAVKFRRKIVIVDNWSIPHMLSTPI